MNRNLIIYICLSLILYSLVGLFISGEYLESLGALVIVILNILILYITKSKGMYIKFYGVELVLVLSVFHSFLGKFMNLYKTIEWWDKFLHAYGTFSVTLLLLSFLHFKSSNLLSLFIIVYSLGSSLGVMFEVFEYILDIVMKTKSQHGLDDTMLDLILNNLGSFLAALMYLYKDFIYRRRIC
ncbi:hypothetical protein [Alkalithermobacter paradoxus]|uniref:VanZ like family protein n=1 Tax=Alkalithermobacter paradoxus TaxID=29349 RepID=A0A1V4ICE4_9FIRM|nr:hypothetical protein CLOTH_05780 [[Clostridium] thermoalcaliphilum]